MITPSIPLRLTPEDKLDALRHLDQAARWTSLDDQRYCLRCGHVIDGRQIEVLGGTRPLGPLRIACPTAGCPATPDEWVLPVRRRKKLVRKNAKPDGIIRAQPKRKSWLGHATFRFAGQLADVATDCRAILTKLRPFPRPRFSSLL